MQEGWDKSLWISRLLKQNKQDIMDKLDSIENIFKKAGDATATDSDIVKPKTAYNGNTLLTGTLEDKTGTTSYTANTTLDSTNKLLRMQVPSVGKYGVGNYLQQSFANIANLIGLTSAKLLKNNTILGITGNSSNMDTSTCDVAAAQILSGKKAGVKGNTVTGTMANKAGTTVKAAAVTQDDNNTYFTLPAAGYYDTASKVYTENSNLGNDDRGGYSIYIDGNANPSICCGLFYKNYNWKLLHIQHWYYTELGTRTWYDIQLKWNQATLSFDITILEDCYYSYNIDMSDKKKISKGKIISVYHRNVTTIYFQSV